MTERERLRAVLVDRITHMGYPESFGNTIADQLRTEWGMNRIIGYLKSAKPGSAEEIADEMLAICDDRDRWTQKKEAEYYNSKYDELQRDGLGD